MKSSVAIADNAVPIAALREYPSKLFVETTSRCNLNCVMCMKQNDGAAADGDLEPATFAALESAFPTLEALVLNGVGEPLLNLRLEQFIARARKLMPVDGWIGFQTNGLLLSNLRAMALVAAGVDRVCLSMDGVTPETFSAIRAGGELRDLEYAMSSLADAKAACRRPDVRVGVEYVAMRDNLEELPAALRWAAAHGASFAIVSHLHPFDETHLPQCSFDTCTDEALSLYHVWQNKADIAGVDIRRYFQLLFKFRRTPEEERIINFVEAMRNDAQYRGVTLDLKRLFAMDYGRLEMVAGVFDRAEEVARETGLELRLPAVVPRQRRSCAFVEEGGAFISRDGGMHPCYHLWHRCRSFANGWLSPVRPRVFGTVTERGILDLWNSDEFRGYRENVLRHDYPACAACNFAPCDYLQDETFSQDCYVNAEPCGSCLWSTGVFQCLS
ncbi:MAG TPA: radical SAM/SPASM family putative metalloenzyme maturase [Geobacteraceae bacterium]